MHLALLELEGVDEDPRDARVDLVLGAREAALRPRRGPSILPALGDEPGQVPDRREALAIELRVVADHHA
jgi:hypothetical protein